VTTPDIGEQGDVFGPYPASAQEREQRVRVVFGEQGPHRQLQMRAVRHRCPGCREGSGRQCTQGTTGGRRAPRRLCHPSRIAVTHPCPEHHVRVGEPCPGEHPLSGLPGVCEARELAARDDLTLHAETVLAAAKDRERQLVEAARSQRTYLERAHLTVLDRQG
jgi:hypothetical protein